MPFKTWLGEPSDELVSLCSREEVGRLVDVSQDGRIINLNKMNIVGLCLQQCLSALIALKQLHRWEVFRAE